MSVAILLATKNGNPWLGEQLNSLIEQTYCDWTLHVSDDGSTDGTWDTLLAFEAENSFRVHHLLHGPQNGMCRNFLSLLNVVPEGAKYVAFCDQDDVWFPDKLARAVSALDAAQGPALYGARTRFADASLKPLRRSPLFKRPPNFANALVQSLAGGNTMVMNRAAFDLARQHAWHAAGTTSHDWWLYQLMTGLGAKVIYDPEPCLLYRQHGRNLVGENRSLKGITSRLHHLREGRFKAWTEANLAALAPSVTAFTPEARATYWKFCAARGAPQRMRAKALRQSGVARQSRAETSTLRAAAAFGLV